MKAFVRAGVASALVVLMLVQLLLPLTASAATMTLTAAADAFVLSSSPTANRGVTSPLRVRAGQKITYIRFNVPPVGAGTTISSATLRMYASNASRCGTGGVQILRASNDTWGERTITWSNQPGSAGPPLASASWTGSGYRGFAVTAAVTAGQPVSFVIRHPDGCITSADTTFVSREASANRPELVVETTVAVPPAQCSDGQDNDGDGIIDLADPGCTDASDTDETDPPPPPPPACSDGQDNDADGHIDLADPGCIDTSDTDETDPPPPTACSDGQDNDGDGIIDLADPGCTDASDTDETDPPPPPPPACSDGQDNDADGHIDLADPGCIDTSDTDETDPPPPTACSDGQDNDGDGIIDLADPGCTDASDTDETDPPPPPPPACSDGQDNDADGHIDLADPGCIDTSDTDETDPPPPTACSDGQDNDGDGIIDLADPGCTDASDTDETDPIPAACADGRDNDGDGVIDLADPGCAGPTDDDERDLAPGGGGPGGAIFSCQATGQVANVDPIVFPGQVAEHTHQFYGASPVHMTETSAELRTHATTCVETDNRSAFWMPTVEEDGVRLLPGTTATGEGKHALIYYRCRHSTSVCANMQPFPENFGHVNGNRHAMSAAENPAFRNGLGGWRCGTGGGTLLPTPPTTCSSGVLVASVTFGNCLLPNGTLSDAVDTGCTSVGGRPILRIQQYFRFWVGTGTVGRITMGGGHLEPHQLHADYFFGWITAASDNFMRICVNANRDCGTNPNV